MASGSQKSSQMASALPYGQLLGSSTLQPAQSQLCYQYDATAQPALATSPVQSDPLMAAQTSQIIGSQLVQQRSATSVLMSVVDFNSTQNREASLLNFGNVNIVSSDRRRSRYKDEYRFGPA